MIKVWVGMPSATGFPYPETIINILQQELPPDVELLFDRTHIIDRMPIQLARNELMQKYLYYSDAEYFWWCDDDNPPTIDCLKQLLSHKKDIVSGLVPLRKGNYRLCIVKNGKPMETVEGLQGPLIEVDNIGTGCVLLSREICEKVWLHTKGHPYQFRVEDTVWNIKNDCKELYKQQDKTIDNWKEIYKLNEDGNINVQQRMLGEDLFFGERAKELGYKFYADLRANCYHFTGENPKRFVKNEYWIGNPYFEDED